MAKITNFDLTISLPPVKIKPDETGKTRTPRARGPEDEKDGWGRPLLSIGGCVAPPSDDDLSEKEKVENYVRQFFPEGVEIKVLRACVEYFMVVNDLSIHIPGQANYLIHIEAKESQLNDFLRMLRWKWTSFVDLPRGFQDKECDTMQTLLTSNTGLKGKDLHSLLKSLIEESKNQRVRLVKPVSFKILEE